MQWSKLKNHVEVYICGSLKGKLREFDRISTEYTIQIHIDYLYCDAEVLRKAA